MENSVCSHACRCFDRCLGWSRQCSTLWRLRSWHSSTGLFFRAVYTGTRPGFPRHQGGEGVAGTPGACSQVFCHSFRCISGAWQDRLPRVLIICTTHSTFTQQQLTSRHMVQTKAFFGWGNESGMKVVSASVEHKLIDLCVGKNKSCKSPFTQFGLIMERL